MSNPPFDRELTDKILLESLSGMGTDSLIFVKKSIAIAARIRELLEAKGIKPAELATATGKSKAEVSRWLTGMHNFTVRTLAKIEAVLGEDVCVVPKPTTQKATAAGKVSKAPVAKRNLELDAR